MASAGLRCGVIGATGALGSEVLACLEDSPLPISELRPVATEDSLGSEVELHGEARAVETEPRSLRGLDVVFLCTPPAAALDWIREALHAQVPCIDVSGSLASNAEVPLGVAAFRELRGDEVLVAAPSPAALAWALVLRPLAQLGRLRRVFGTLLEAASSGGRDGIEALYRESLAIFNQGELPEPGPCGRPVAFDVLPSVGPLDAAGTSPAERALVSGLRRLVDPELRVAVSQLQVPAFVGQGAALHVEAEVPIEPKQAREQLAAAPGVSLWQEGDEPLTLRTVAGQAQAWVSRIRSDAAAGGGLQLWLAADALRLSAANAVAIAEGRWDAR